jgi:hypothetical protein
MTDYWLSKLMFDLQAPDKMVRWKADRAAVLDDYPLSPEARQAALDDDVAVLAPRVNAYLLRFYLSGSGMDDTELLARLHALKPAEETNIG